MHKSVDSTKRFRAKVQRSQAGKVLGACVALSGEDLRFVDSGTEWLTIEKRHHTGGLIIEIGGE